jgi:hypothetical protein
MVGGAPAPDGTAVSGSVRVSARLFPARLFGYTFLGNAKKVCLQVSCTLFLHCVMQLLKSRRAGCLYNAFDRDWRRAIPRLDQK